MSDIISDRMGPTMVTLRARLLRGLLHSFLLCLLIAVILGICLGTLTAFETEAVRRGVARATSQLGLSSSTTAMLTTLAGGLVKELALELGLLGAKSLVLLLSLFVAGDVVNASVIWVASKLLRNEAVTLHDPTDKLVADKLFRFGLVALVAVGVVLALVGSIAWRFMPWAIVAVLVLFVLAALALVAAEWRRIVATGAAGHAALARFLSTPFRRFRLWTIGTIGFAQVYLLLYGLVPWMCVRARALPTQVGERVERTEFSRKLAEVRLHAAIDQHRTSEFTTTLIRDSTRLASILDNLAQAPHSLRTGLVAATSEWTEREVSAFSHKALLGVAALLAASFLGVAVLPLVMAGVPPGMLVSIALTALIPLPAAYVLDRAGITSAFPLPFLLVYGALGMLDAIVSSRSLGPSRNAYWVRGRILLHTERSCPALRASPEDRIEGGDAGLQIRAGFRYCRRCSS